MTSQVLGEPLLDEMSELFMNKMQAAAAAGEKYPAALQIIDEISIAK